MSARFPITNPRIQDYLLGLARVRRGVPARCRAVLAAMEREAERTGFPIIGPVVGPLLHQLAVMIRARRVLELGSGFGYSAVWFARAVGPRGRVVMTENDPANARRALRHLRRAGLASRVRSEVGDALEILARARGTFDLILNDVDKHEYPQVLPLARKKLRKGGLLVCDNMLWGGDVIRGRPDRATRGILELTARLYHADDFVTTLLPIRDGVSVSIRL